MRNKVAIFGVLFGVLLILGIASNAISTVYYSSFAAFEIFYFICIALSIITLCLSKKNAKHVVGSILLVNLGYFVNCFLWTVLNQSGVGQILNSVLTAIIFLTLLTFIHALNGGECIKKLSFALSIVLGLCTVGVAVYNLIVNLSTPISSLYVWCIIIQNLSLISTLVLPFAQIYYIKNR